MAGTTTLFRLSCQKGYLAREMSRMHDGGEGIAAMAEICGTFTWLYRGGGRGSCAWRCPWGDWGLSGHIKSENIRADQLCLERREMNGA